MLKSSGAETVNVVSAGAKGCHLTGVPTDKTGETEESAMDHLNILELNVFFENICCHLTRQDSGCQSQVRAHVT